MTDPIETVPASALSPADLGGDTRVTPTIAGGEASAPSSSAPAAPPAPGLELDTAGVAFDPAKHEGGRKGDGTWKLKRGSGARKAKGLPLTLPEGKGKSRVFIPPPAPAAQPGEAPAPTPGAAGAVVDALPAPLTEADFATTAASVVGTLFALAALLLGAAWKLSGDELTAWREAIARLWAHYQWSRVSPLIEVLSLGMITVEKRADDPETKRRLGKLADWLVPSRKAKRAEAAPADDQVDDAKAAA